MIGKLCVAAGLALLWLPTAASAQDTGLSGLHEKVRVGGKVCFADHFHFGTSNGQRSRKLAEIEAIRSWEGFTAWEYGDAWGRFANAVSKGVKCSQSGGSWGCDIEARPCRR